MDNQKVTKLERLQACYDAMVKRINEDPDNVMVEVSGGHNPTELDEVDGHRRFIEGNREITITVKENRPRSYYLNLHKSKQTI